MCFSRAHVNKIHKEFAVFRNNFFDEIEISRRCSSAGYHEIAIFSSVQNRFSKRIFIVFNDGLQNWNTSRTNYRSSNCIRIAIANFAFLRNSIWANQFTSDRNYRNARTTIHLNIGHTTTCKKTRTCSTNRLSRFDGYFASVNFFTFSSDISTHCRGSPKGNFPRSTSFIFEIIHNLKFHYGICPSRNGSTRHNTHAGTRLYYLIVVITCRNFCNNRKFYRVIR